MKFNPSTTLPLPSKRNDLSTGKVAYLSRNSYMQEAPSRITIIELHEPILPP